MEIPDTYTTSMPGCARCHGGHESVTFRRLTYPFRVYVTDNDDGSVLADVEMTHWAPCPTNGEPILMRWVPDA